jgi:valyl-tRNA synthetase
VNAELERRNLAQAADRAYEHVWHDFCDWYVELAKTRLYGDDPAQKARAQATLAGVFESILRLLHPIMPFITEELWQALTGGARGCLAVQPYPRWQADWDDPDAAGQWQVVSELPPAIHSTQSQLKRAYGLPRVPSLAYDVSVPPEAHDYVVEHAPDILRATGAAEIRVHLPAEAPPPNAFTVGTQSRLDVTPDLTSFVVDTGDQLARLDKQIAQLDAEGERSRKKLANEGFTTQAPPEVVEKERGKLAEAEERAAELRRARLNLLKGS